jgi:hypothetical protein
MSEPFWGLSGLILYETRNTDFVAAGFAGNLGSAFGSAVRGENQAVERASQAKFESLPRGFCLPVEQKGVGGGGRKLRPVRQDIAFQHFTYGFYRARGANGVDGASFCQGHPNEYLYRPGICPNAGGDVS